MSSAFLRKLQEQQVLSILQTGMYMHWPPAEGSVKAAHTCILNTGVCGSVTPEHEAGEIVRPAQVRSGGKVDVLPIADGIAGTLVTVPDAILSAESKKRIPGDFVDMEAYSQAVWCRTHARHFYCLKIIADTLATPPTLSAHLAAARLVLPLLTGSVENLVKNLVENGRLQRAE